MRRRSTPTGWSPSSPTTLPGDLTSCRHARRQRLRDCATTTYAYDGDGEQTSHHRPGREPLRCQRRELHHRHRLQHRRAARPPSPRLAASGAPSLRAPPPTATTPNGNQTTVQDARGYTTTTSLQRRRQGDLGHRSRRERGPDLLRRRRQHRSDRSAGRRGREQPHPGVLPDLLPVRVRQPAAPLTPPCPAFDALGKQTQQTSPAPAGQSGYETTTYTYDGNGNVTQTTAPPAGNGGAESGHRRHLRQRRAAGLRDDRVRHISGVDDHVLLRPEREQDRRRGPRRQRLRHRGLRGILAMDREFHV